MSVKEERREGRRENGGEVGRVCVKKGDASG
jgi:hypothetical protein